MNTVDTMEQRAATRMELELEGLNEIRRRGRGRSGREGGRAGGVQMQVDEVGVRRTSSHNKHLCTCTGELQGTNDLEKFVWRMATPFGCLFFVAMQWSSSHQEPARVPPTLNCHSWRDAGGFCGSKLLSGNPALQDKGQLEILGSRRVWGG